MTEQEIKDFMTEGGWSLHSYSGDKRSFTYTKWFNHRARPCAIGEGNFVIFCNFHVEGEYQFQYITDKGFFDFKSQYSSNMERFDNTEIDFVMYCISLNKTKFL